MTAAEEALADLAAASARIAALVEAGADLHAAFVKHRTATHEIKPKHCQTCRESDAALERWRAARGEGG